MYLYTCPVFRPLGQCTVYMANMFPICGQDLRLILMPGVHIRISIDSNAINYDIHRVSSHCLDTTGSLNSVCFVTYCSHVAAQ